jgi:hypothetical protein
MTIDNVTLNRLPLSVTNGIFCMYRVTFAAGESIQGRKVKENMISCYLTAAALDF